ncbi:ABC1-domain-containing protein [Aureobasidium subglaciale]|nr:ABC1-domain-containing protein [Aureobasidium subglaciale]
MAGRRLLDAARLFNVSGSIAKHHFNIRAQQWELFTQTSSLAKAVKNQTDRVTLTARAAYALSRRVNETGPTYTQTTRHDEEPIPSQETVQGAERTDIHEVGLGQDHHWDRSDQNAVAEAPPQGDLHVNQEKARRHPLPDGTIPPEGAVLDPSPSRQGTDTFNQRPLTDAPKHPLAEQQSLTNDLHPTESGASTIPIPAVQDSNADHNVKLQRKAEFQIPSVSGHSQSASTLGQDTFSTRPTKSSVELSSLPRTKIPKSAEDTQGGDDHVKDGQINQDVYYSSGGHPNQTPIPQKEAFPVQEETPEGINTDIFHSPRVASLLNSGGREDRRKAYELKMKAARKGSAQPIQESIKAGDRNPDTFSARPGTSSPQADTSSAPIVKPAAPATEAKSQISDKETQELANAIAADATAAASPAVESEKPGTPYQLRESAVPSSRFGRLWQYGGLATSMAFGAVGESLRRVTGGAAAAASGSLLLSPANMERLVAKLSRMRGAALKLGQMMSFQDSKMLPPAINAVLQRVQDSADYMPPWQRNKQLAANLGADWKDLFSSFEDVPIAAASIGQVHRATLASNGRAVAVKIQYPGVRGSIDSDLNNLSLLLTASRLLPPGLFLDKTIANARTELGWECDYAREAECGTRFASLLEDEHTTFRVPKVFSEACGPEVLTAELMHGKGVTKIPDLSQDERDWIGTQVLRLCLRELMEWRFMQTDPNWTNFLYNRGNAPSERRLELLDFGASREFPESFVTPYVQLLIAASTHDRDACRDLSIKLGYLTGAESQAMLTAHVDSILTLAEPFDSGRAGDYYDFKNQTITDRVREKIGLMVRERLAPPPEETYSLHRKLSGAFLLCARLGANVPAKKLFGDAVAKWKESHGEKN